MVTSAEVACETWTFAGFGGGVAGLVEAACATPLVLKVSAAAVTAAGMSRR
jgi:hypothetical protein